MYRNLQKKVFCWNNKKFNTLVQANNCNIFRFQGWQSVFDENKLNVIKLLMTVYGKSAWATGESIPLQGRQLFQKLFCLPSEKGGLFQKERNIYIPVGANSFLLEYSPFQLRTNVQLSKTWVIKVISLSGNGETFTVPFKPNFLFAKSWHFTC